MKTEVNDNSSNSINQQSKSGRSQSGLRIHNERRILSLIRKEGAISKAKISTKTQTLILYKFTKDTANHGYIRKHTSAC